MTRRTKLSTVRLNYKPKFIKTKTSSSDTNKNSEIVTFNTRPKNNN